MRICKNGVIREMTKEEIERFESLAEHENVQMPPPTEEERLEALESVVLEILGVTTND